MNRQKIRKGLILNLAIIVAFQGIVVGSLVVFSTQLILSLLFDASFL